MCFCKVLAPLRNIRSISAKMHEVDGLIFTSQTWIFIGSRIAFPLKEIAFHLIIKDRMRKVFSPFCVIACHSRCPFNGFAYLTDGYAFN